MNLIPTDESTVSDRQVIEAFCLNCPGLAAAKEVWEQQDLAGVKQGLVSYFENRSNVHFLYDARQLPMKKLNPGASPYSFQSSLGLKGDLKEFRLYTGRKMMDIVYVLPAGRQEVELGEYFEHMIHFNYLEDQGKKHRHQLDMFVRGQFFESLSVLYHETG